MNRKITSAAGNQDAKPALTPKLRFPEFGNAAGWEGKTLAEICTVNPTSDELPESFFYIDLESVEAGKLTAPKKINRNDAPSRAQRLLEPGDTVFQVVRPYQRNNYFFDLRESESYVASTGYAQLRAHNSQVFLYQVIHTDGFVNKVIAKCTGSSYPAINSSDLAEIPLEVPPDPAEQQKIAECLTTLDEVIAAQSQKIDALKTHKKGLMQQLFPREGETLPRLRFPEYQSAPEWEEKSLVDIAEIRSGTTPARANPEYYIGGRIPWVKTTDLNNSLITHTEECITPLAKARINPAGSVLVAMYGGFNQIGRTGCLSVPAATNQAISVLVLNHSIASPPYVLAWLNAKVEVWKRIASSSRKDPNITGSDVAKFSINIPSVPEQQRIAACLTSLDDLITAQSAKLSALKTYKKGLMQQLFPSAEEVEA